MAEVPSANLSPASLTKDGVQTTVSVCVLVMERVHDVAFVTSLLTKLAKLSSPEFPPMDGSAAANFADVSFSTNPALAACETFTSPEPTANGSVGDKLKSSTIPSRLTAVVCNAD